MSRSSGIPPEGGVDPRAFQKEGENELTSESSVLNPDNYNESSSTAPSRSLMPLDSLGEVSESVHDEDSEDATPDGSECSKEYRVTPSLESKTEDALNNSHSYLYLTCALKEEHARSKLFLAVGSCMSEISHIEDVFGKKILKIGSQCTVKGEWPMAPNRIWGQIGTTLERLGKQHIGFHHCVTQSIVRELHSMGNSVMKQSQDLEAEIQILVHDLKKKSAKYTKTYNKYIKTVKDCEAAIKSRDEAIVQYAAKVDKEEKEAYSLEIASYLNRGFNKMMSKIMPFDDFRRIHDRCRALLGEVEDFEINLAVQSDHLLFLHAQVLERSLEMSHQMEQLEKQRLENIKSGLLRFCQASEGMLEHNKNILAKLRELTLASLSERCDESNLQSDSADVQGKSKGTIDFSEDVESLESELKMLVNIVRGEKRPESDSAMSSSRSETDLSSSRSRASSVTLPSGNASLDVQTHLLSLEKLKSALMTLRNNNHEATGLFAEVADVEKSFCEMSIKLFEKYGYAYSKNSSSGTLHVYSRGDNNVPKADEAISETIQESSSPLAQVGWDSLIQAVEKFTEAHSVSSELLLQQCCVSTDVAQRNIESSCNEKTYRAQDIAKEIENMKSRHSKLQSKLDRARKESLDSVGTEEINYLATQVHESSLKNDRAIEEFSVELENLVEALKDEVHQHLESLLYSYQDFLDSNNVKFNIWQRAIRKVRDDVENLSVPNDIKSLRSSVLRACNEEFSMRSNETDLPKFEAFSAVQSDTIDLERSNERDTFLRQQEGHPLSSPPSPERAQCRSPSSAASVSTVNSRLGNIFGGIKAIGDIGFGSKTTLMDVSRGRIMGRKSKKDKRRSRSAGDESKHKSSESKDLNALNDDYKVRQRRASSVIRRDGEDYVDSDGTALTFDDEDVKSVPGTSSVLKTDLVAEEVDVLDNVESSCILDTTCEWNIPVPDSVPDETIVQQKCDDTTSNPDVEARESVSELKNEAETLDEDENGDKIPEPLKQVPSRRDRELEKFGIGSEKIIDHFSCALIPRRGLLTHGRMFVTNNHIAFSGWPELRILIPFESVDYLKKTNTVYIIPNAITIHTIDGEMYFFGSFIDRDPCFEILSSMVNIVKSLAQVMGPNTIGSPAASPMTNVRLVKSSKKHVIEGDSAENQLNSKEAVTVAQKPDSKHEILLDTIYDYDALFESSSITKLHECQLESTSTALWSIAWRRSDGYRGFLESEGDLEISLGEWEVFNDVVNKDTSNLKFHFRRTCSYLHPRTSMLMFGPKNAPAQQVQYLHIPEWSDKDSSFVSLENLDEVKVMSNAVVMTVTQFDGIPMSDVFRVYMYWSFEAKQDSAKPTEGPVAASRCLARMGLRVDFLKSTMIKGQIFSGTKDELVALSKQWEKYFAHAVSQSRAKEVAVATTSQMRHCVYLDKILSYDTLFESSSITKLHECQLESTSTALWSFAWRRSDGYRGFLESEGDLEISLGEWEVFNDVVNKDTSNLKFHFRRTCSYLHPRTSMLMFGPKNAPAQQVQYLHIPEWSDKDSSFVSLENLDEVKVMSNAVVMTVTQFDGIPMSDVFRVYMYWSFEAKQDSAKPTEGPVAASRCLARMGLRVDFLKSTMIKGQIFSGTKDELVALSKQWEKYFAHEVEKMPNQGVETSQDEDVEVANLPSIEEQVMAALVKHEARSSDKSSPFIFSWKWTMANMVSLSVLILCLIQFLILLYLLKRLSNLEKLLQKIPISDADL